MPGPLSETMTSTHPRWQSSRTRTVDSGGENSTALLTRFSTARFSQLASPLTLIFCLLTSSTCTRRCLARSSSSSSAARATFSMSSSALDSPIPCASNRARESRSLIKAFSFSADCEIRWANLAAASGSLTTASSRTSAAARIDAKLVKLLRRLRREFIFRFRTRREGDTTDLYEAHVVDYSSLWSALKGALRPREQRSFLRNNIECFPLCTVPVAHQQVFIESARATLNADGVQLRNEGLSDLGPCPYEAQCAFGTPCFGIHDFYVGTHGMSAFEPDAIHPKNLRRIERHDWSAMCAAKAILRLNARIGNGLREGDWRDATDALVELLEVAGGTGWAGEAEATMQLFVDRLVAWTIDGVNGKDGKVVRTGVELLHRLGHEQRSERRFRIATAFPVIPSTISASLGVPTSPADRPTKLTLTRRSIEPRSRRKCRNR